jgi:protein TonB
MANAQTASALDVLWRQAPGGELLDLGRVYRGPLALSRLHTTPGRILSRREAVLLGVFALVLHGAVIYFAVITDNLVIPAFSIDAIARATSP